MVCAFDFELMRGAILPLTWSMYILTNSNLYSDVNQRKTIPYAVNVVVKLLDIHDAELKYISLNPARTPTISTKIVSVSFKFTFLY